MNKSLIIYYSYSGHNRKVANEIAGFLKANIIEIKDWLQKLPFPILFFVGGMIGSKRIPSKINSINIDLSKYDRIILLCPVWGWKLVPAMRTFLIKYKKFSSKFFLVCVCGGGKKYTQEINSDYQIYFGDKPHKLLMISDTEFDKNAYQKEISNFLNRV